MEAVAQHGYNVTVDEIAVVSGVSPRTIFRHYASHDELIAATVKDMFEACGLPRSVDELGGWIEGVSQLYDDVDGLIDDIAVTFHVRSASIFGAAFWDICAPRPTASTALAEVDALRRDYRLRGMHYWVNLIWEAAGGTGEPPEDLVLGFALNLSVFTTQALIVGFDQTPSQIGALTAEILKMLLRQAVEAQHERDDADGPES